MIIRTIVSLAAVLACLGGPAEARRASQMFAPANDQIANAITLSSNSWLTAGHLFFASKQPSEPKVDAGAIGRTVWYRYTAKSTGRVAVMVAPNRAATLPFRLAVYAGSEIGSLSLRGRAAVATGSSTPAAVVFDVTEGVTYSIQVDSGTQQTLNGYFLIGLQQFGPNATAGGVALFADRPVYVTEGAGTTRTVFAVNATKSNAVITPKLAGFSEALNATASTTAVAPGVVVPVTVADNTTIALPATGATVGTLSVAATVGTTTVASQTTVVTAVKTDTATSPRILVRFDKPGQGVAAAGTVRSLVTLRNVGSVAARACRFEPGSATMTLHFADMTTGRQVNADRLFDIPTGSTLRYTVSAAGAVQADDTVELACGHTTVTTTTDDTGSMFGYEQFGQPSIAAITFSGVNAEQKVAIPDAGVRTVVAAITNVGDYAGFFSVTPTTTDQTLARVASLCVSNASGVCLGLPATGSVSVNLTNGERTYVALSVTRTTSTANGLVFVTVASTDGPATRTAAYDGFTVISP